MSVNTRNPTSTCLITDPFLFCSKSEGLDDCSRSGSWSSQLLLSSYPSLENSFTSGDQFCPSSSPSSPVSVANLSSPLFYPYDEEPYFIKEEPDQCYEGFHFDEALYRGGSGDFVGIPPLEAPSESFGNIPPLTPELEERYQDFMQIFNIEASSLFYPTVGDLIGMEVEESDDGVTSSSPSTPNGSVSGISGTGSGVKRTSSRLGESRAKASRVKKAVKKGALGSSGGVAASADSTGAYQKLSQLKNGAGAAAGSDHSRRTSPSGSPSMSMTSDDDLPSGGSQKQSKRSSKSASPEAYVRRREKNNIAVRKSREKKRQEIKKFADEHTKLKREVDHIRAQNEKLRNLVMAVEDGIVVEKSKAELEALIRNAKKQLNWC